MQDAARLKVGGGGGAVPGAQIQVFTWLRKVLQAERDARAAPVYVLACIGQLGAGSDGGGGQEASVRAQGEEPSLQDVPGHCIIGAGVVDPGRVVMLDDVHMQLVAQLLLAQHTRHKIPPDVLQTAFTQVTDILPGPVRQIAVCHGGDSTLSEFNTGMKCLKPVLANS